jgi:hypothetical protein
VSTSHCLSFPLLPIPTNTPFSFLLNLHHFQNSWKPILETIESRFDAYLDQENRVNRSQISDTRVNACLYFIAPTGHSLKALDIEFMKRLHKKVNLIPVIAKSDTMTNEEIAAFKERVRLAVLLMLRQFNWKQKGRYQWFKEELMNGPTRFTNPCTVFTIVHRFFWILLTTILRSTTLSTTTVMILRPSMKLRMSWYEQKNLLHGSSGKEGHENLVVRQLMDILLLFLLFDRMAIEQDPFRHCRI